MRDAGLARAQRALAFVGRTDTPFAQRRRYGAFVALLPSSPCRFHAHLFALHTIYVLPRSFTARRFPHTPTPIVDPFPPSLFSTTLHATICLRFAGVCTVTHRACTSSLPAFSPFYVNVLGFFVGRFTTHTDVARIFALSACRLFLRYCRIRRRRFDFAFVAHVGLRVPRAGFSLPPAFRPYHCRPLHLRFPTTHATSSRVYVTIFFATVITHILHCSTFWFTFRYCGFHISPVPPFPSSASVAILRFDDAYAHRVRCCCFCSFVVFVRCCNLVLRPFRSNARAAHTTELTTMDILPFHAAYRISLSLVSFLPYSIYFYLLLRTKI